MDCKKNDKYTLLKFGEAVRNHRKKMGISQEELADKCELDRTYVGSVERGERNISLINIIKIAKGLDVQAQDLLSGID